MPKLSIITICLNQESVIGETIRSVLCQQDTDYEYLIKDGMSKDGTVRVAKSFADAFAQKGVKYRVISRADEGVYDAMNQATAEAKGEWVIYLNSGDCLAGPSVLGQLFSSNCMDTADIVYGDTIQKDQKLYRYTKACALKEISNQMPFCHQSTLIRKSLMEQEQYSINYRICSDYRFFLNMYQQQKRFAYLPMVIAVYDINGMSANTVRRYQEIISILKEMPVWDEQAIQLNEDKLKRAQRTAWIRKWVCRLIPQRVLSARRKRIEIHSGWKTAEAMLEQEKVDYEPNAENHP